MTVEYQLPDGRGSYVFTADEAGNLTIEDRTIDGCCPITLPQGAAHALLKTIYDGWSARASTQIEADGVVPKPRGIL